MMKKLLFALLIGLSSQISAQQIGAFQILVVNQNGSPLSNIPVTVTDYSSGSGMSITSLTNTNGIASDSLSIGNTGTLVAMAGTLLCTDSTSMSYTPNNGPWVWLIDTLVICGTSGANCNFAFGASVSQINNQTFSFWHQANSVSTFWDFGDGTSSTQFNPSHFYNVPGTYIYCVTVDSCPQVCDTVVVSASPQNCNASFIIDTVNSQPGNVVIWNTSTPNNAPGNQYLWDFGDGNTSQQAYPYHSYINPGAYELCLTLTTQSTPTSPSCTSTYCDSLGVDSLGNLILKSNGAGFSLNVLDPSTISVEEEILTDFTLYPNPSNGEVTVSFETENNAKIKFDIVDLNGRVITIDEGDAIVGINNIRLDLSFLENGMYMLMINIDGKVYHEKIVKL